MPKGFLPNADSALLTWSGNFSTVLNASPESYGVPAERAADFADLQAAYAAAYQKAIDPGTRGLATVCAKNTVRAALRTEARLLSRLIQAQPTLTDVQRVELGLSVRKRSVRIGVPETAPVIEVSAVEGRQIHVRLSDSATTGSRGKPHGVVSGTMYWFFGEQYPAAESEWTPAGWFSRADLTLNLPDHVPPGTRVWLTAKWLNPRSQSGPMARPVQTYAGGGVTMRAAA